MRAGRSGAEDQAGPAGRGVHVARAVRHRLEGTHHRGPDGNHPASDAVGLVDQPGGGVGDREPLGLRGLVGLLAGDAGVEHERCDHHAAADQAHQDAFGQRSAGARHLGAAGPVCVHVLQVVQRHGGVQVAVADRAAVLAQVVDGVAPGRGNRAPQPVLPGWVRLGHPEAEAAGQAQDLALGDVGGSGPVGTAYLDHPGAVVELGGDVHGLAGAFPVQVDGGGKGGGGVHHQQVAGTQLGGQVPDPAVGQQPGPRHQHLHRVSGEAAGLGRRGRFGDG